ncbi:amidohydrolase family protein [Pyrococcus abyssi]|uniref:Deoxyribonuclease TatD, related n=1 Tax=Pyrococcus abyssi (strain GE5 / Orsay) TaxID=272844 RepID=Q9V2H6_PYRAB|nr:amidohydrolase family protein [Pyrococcus abyssi]CAB49022.1 Putative deoxyribonuclease TatD, related [Pyrococcus abyssi GE5]CCE69474.1 TPA: hypothetical protein PAB0058 [Pyrococcus abyssi GE5]
MLWRTDVKLTGDNFKKIDFHAHIQSLGYPFNVEINVEEFLALMEAYNIEKAIISDLNNERIAEITREYPDKFIGIAWVDPREKDIDKYFRFEFKGIKLHPLLHMFSPGDPVVERVMKIARDYGLPVFIHSGHPPTSLPWQIEDLARKFPDVPIVIIHMGHGNAFYIQGAIEIAERNENVYLETSGMPMPAKIKQAYERTPDKVMFGTDLPCHHPVVEIAKVLTSGLDERGIKKVLYENARKFIERWMK